MLFKSTAQGNFGKFGFKDILKIMFKLFHFKLLVAYGKMFKVSFNTKYVYEFYVVFFVLTTKP